MPTNEKMSPYFRADEYRPVMSGPFECRPVLPYGKTDELFERREYFRWYDLEMGWSLPLAYDPDLDDKLERPEEWPCLKFSESSMEQLATFEWRGFNEDQDPL